MALTYHSNACEIIHRSMARLFVVGLLDTQRMLEFDRLCLSGPRSDAGVPQIEPALQSALDLRALRAREGMSLIAFAKYFNVPPQTVISWEAGTAQPSAIIAQRLRIVAKEGLRAAH